MTTYIIQIVSAVLGSLGFALVFNLRKDKMPYALFGAGAGWAVYLIFYHFTENNFVANMAASIFCAATAEAFARWRKAPSTLFLLVEILPLVPGGSLYYTMRSFVLKDHGAFTYHGLNTLYVSAGIAVGILVVTSCIYILNSYKKKQ